MNKEQLGDRMKSNYENITRNYLPRRTNTIIRLDGKAFHNFTKGFDRPFDMEFIKVMNLTARYLCENIQGCKMAYVQSDEISLLLTDYDNLKTDAWFGGNIQKIVSISASMATAYFNSIIKDFKPNVDTLGMFDSRVFTISDDEEVVNYFVWRQKDWERNSIQLMGQSIFSHKELHKKSCNEIQEMCFQKGINWNDYAIFLKRGRTVIYKDNEWVIDNAMPIITHDRDYIKSLMIKNYNKGELNDRSING